MRRNNIFMGAYIVFVFICFFARLKSEYSAWPSVVSAVAISSAFFAFADFLYIYAQSLRGICDVTNSYISDAREMLDEERWIFLGFRERIRECSLEEFDFSEMTKLIDLVMEENGKTEEWIKENEAATLKKQKEVKRDKAAAAFLTFLGFLLFLCIVVFDTLATACVAIQDTISVFAFGLILVTQYVHTILSEKTQKDVLERDEKRKSYDKRREHMEILKEKVNKFFAEVENAD